MHYYGVLSSMKSQKSRPAHRKRLGGTIRAYRNNLGLSQEKLAELVTPKTVMTSIMYANNEIGTIEPIKKISNIVHDNGQYLHVDATAVGGYLPLDVQKENIWKKYLRNISTI